MGTLQKAAAFGWVVLIAGCCNESVFTGVYVGHLSPEQCRDLLLQRAQSSQPDPRICPGDEVTLCWGTENIAHPTVTIETATSSSSMTSDGPIGIKYLRPTENTTLTVAGSCTAQHRQVSVITGAVPAHFDAHWAAGCTGLGYHVDPLYNSPGIKALDVKTEWAPEVSDPNGGTGMCPTPPFLGGQHPDDLYFFSVDRPMVTTTFSSPQPLVGDWNYPLRTCPPMVCNPDASEAFTMTLECL